MKSRLLSGFTALALACAIAGCGSKPPVTAASNAESSLKPGEKRNQAPEFALKDADGREVKLSDYKGKVVLLNFWATWCGPCKFEIPWFVEFEKQYKDKGFAVLGVAMDEDGWDAVKPYVSEKQVNYRVVMGNDSVAQLYGGIDSLPTTFIIDKDGKIASTHVGLAAKADFENEIKALLN